MPARIVALYDIHGNLPALEAVLAEIEGIDVDLVVVGGDVMPGPMPVECLRRLMALDVPVRWLRGNGDREVLAIRSGDESGAVPPQFLDAMRWNAAQLDDDLARFVSDWPLADRVALTDAGDVLFCHATPRNDTEIFTRLTAEERLLPIFAGYAAPLVVCGHTHMQFDRTVGQTRVVNAGSVGMPFGDPGAYWLLLGPGVELRRTTYDLRAAAAQVRATTYPGAEAFAATNVLEPPGEAMILETLSKAELT